MHQQLSWQQSLSNVVTNTDELCALLDICAEDSELLRDAQQSFALRVPREFIARMEKGNPNDPLLLQVLPQAIEMQEFPGFTENPLQENKKNPVPGLLHKYPNRVLLTLTGGCAINCRYCFRRHFPYEDNLPGRANWHRAFDYIAKNAEIDEVIFSGGDPLLLKDALLADFVSQLESIPHVTRLRIHTRLPIVIPSRVTDDLIQILSRSRFQIAVVVHCNHANEIDASVKDALKKLRAISVALNQSVLLKNVNDHADTLVALSKKLFACDVLPYYLHLLDKVSGSAHFDVSEEKANELMAEIKKKLPGFLVPRLAREMPELLHKSF